ncbi:MAG: sulfatase [Myxococcota bacterium]
MPRPSESAPSRLAAAGGALLCLALLSLVPTCVTGPSKPRPPGDVVLILLDTLRPDHLGFYGYPKETAPFLAKWAREGAVFERAHSTSSWTAPATASLFTGLYPTGHGVIEGFFAHRGRMTELSRGGSPVLPLNRLPDSLATLPERFARAGYRTFGAASNVNIGPHIGFDRGFDRFHYAHKQSARKVLAEVGSWRDAIVGSAAPTFLYLHLNDVHSPYERREPWFEAAEDPRAREISAYDSQISYVDRELARLSAKLDWQASTLVAVVSDHGEEFGEHGGRRHDGGLHQELTRVLMLFRGPGVPATRIAQDVSLVDVLPTLAELAGLPPEDPNAPSRDGRSLVPLMEPDAPERAGERAGLEERALFAHRAMKREHFGRHWWAVVRDGWKLIADPDRERLYDHRDDFGEQRDRAASEPERAHALRSELDGFRARGFHSDSPTRAVPLDRDLLEALEELGYVEPAPAP